MKSSAMTVLLIASLLGGCAAMTNGTQRNAATGSECHQEADSERRMQLDMIQQRADEGQFYSALAHLEAAGLDSPSAQLVRAEALRRTGRQDEALAVYERLTRTCISAYGHLGKGKILAVRDQLSEAREQIETARQQAPTDADIRNDLGFVMLVAGDHEQAQREFMTALELHNEHGVARRNLILSMILSGDIEDAWRFAKRHGIALEEFENLIERSANFQRQRVATAERLEVPDRLLHLDFPVLEETGGPL